MDIISKAAADEALAEAQRKVQRYATTEVDRPDITKLREGDEWFNLDTGRTMVVMSGLYVEKPSTPAPLVGFQDKLDLKATKEQTSDTETVYTDKSDGKKYKMYIKDGQITLEEVA